MVQKVDLVYMVAGMSSRFGGKIKQFAEIGPGGEKLIEYSIKQALPAGFSKIVFIVGNLTEKPFKQMFGTQFEGVPVEYASQTFNPKERDRPWGTVDALCSIKGIVKNPFIICNGDDLYGTKNFQILAEHLKRSKEEAVIGYKLLEVLPETGSTNRGIFQVDSGGDTLKIEEIFDVTKSNLAEKNLTPDSLCNMNLFAFHPEIILLLEQKLKVFKETHNSDRKAECLLPIELSHLIAEDKIKIKIYPSQGKWFGVTNPDDAERVKNQIKEIEKAIKFI